MGDYNTYKKKHIKSHKKSKYCVTYETLYKINISFLDFIHQIVNIYITVLSI